MLNQVQSRQTQLRILPKQIQLLNIYHLNTLQLEQRIMDELNDNPLLEEAISSETDNGEKFSKDSVQDFMNWEEYGYDDIPDYKKEYENYLPPEKTLSKPLPDVIDFRENLKTQYAEQFEQENIEIAHFLIDSLNDHGILDQDLNAIADSISFATKKWVDVPDIEAVLLKIQTLEPVGIGARSLQECLLLQLRRMNGKRPDVKKSLTLLEDYFHDLQTGNLEKIKYALEIEDDELKILLQLIASLSTRPAEAEESSTASKNILPDFIITVDGYEIEVALFRSRSEGLYINRAWLDTVQDADKNKNSEKSTKQYLKSKLLSAQWFISAIQQREGNMLKVMRTIVEYQKNYFITGDVMTLRPMILKNIADLTALDISTISRITSNKYADTPFGMILLKDLFTEGVVNQEGTSISNRVIQSSIEEIIAAEDKKNPYTDKQLVNILVEKGYNIARRTVAKYREQLQIPVAQQRAIWSGIAQS